MSTFKIAGAAALCLLTGCADMGQRYYLPIAGMPQTETGNQAYWDCVGQAFKWEMSTPAGWTIPAGAGAGVAMGVDAAPAQHAFMHYCMGQKGYLTKPGMEPPA